jgi:hypothetical protein
VTLACAARLMLNLSMSTANHGLRLTTTAAARYCREHGRQVSTRTLQAYRRKAPGTSGERGPVYWKDPETRVAYYSTADLDTWIKEFENRLVKVPGAGSETPA